MPLILMPILVDSLASAHAAHAAVLDYGRTQMVTENGLSVSPSDDKNAFIHVRVKPEVHFFDPLLCFSHGLSGLSLIHI